MDAEEFDSFYTTAFLRLVTQVHAMTGDREEARDCVQEAFVAAGAAAAGTRPAHVCDLSVQEVAAEIRVPEGTVKARLSRGRAALRSLLADPCQEMDEGVRHA